MTWGDTWRYNCNNPRCIGCVDNGTVLNAKKREVCSQVKSFDCASWRREICHVIDRHHMMCRVGDSASFSDSFRLFSFHVLLCTFLDISAVYGRAFVINAYSTTRLLRAKSPDWMEMTMNALPSHYKAKSRFLNPAEPDEASFLASHAISCETFLYISGLLVTSGVQIRRVAQASTHKSENNI